MIQNLIISLAWVLKCTECIASSGLPGVVTLPPRTPLLFTIAMYTAWAPALNALPLYNDLEELTPFRCHIYSVFGYGSFKHSK